MNHAHTARQRQLKLLVYIILLTGAFVFLLPFYWMVISALKPSYAVLDFPPRWLPIPPRWANFREALTYVPFGRYALNTLFITLFSVLGNLFSATLVAYGFARVRAPGKNVLFLILLATMMLPYPVTMVPVFVIFSKLGWVNSFKPLIVPTFLGAPFYIFLLRQFFLTLPVELEDAARMDGANTFQILLYIILPLAVPAMATIAIFTFQGAWNDFLGPLIYLNDQAHYTITLGLSFFRSTYQTNWAYLMAASLVTMLPMVVLFFFAQRLFIEGITLTGVKG